VRGGEGRQKERERREREERGKEGRGRGLVPPHDLFEPRPCTKPQFIDLLRTASYSSMVLVEY